MLYVLSYPVLSAADAERIEAFRRTHEPERASMVRVHITLVFGVCSIQADDLASEVADLAAATAPFAVSFDRTEETRSLVGLHHLFLLAGEGSKTLEAMHRRLYAGTLRSEMSKEPFRAHMTVATATSAGPVHAAIKDIARIGLPISAWISAVEIIGVRDGRVESLGSFKLSCAQR
jgi:2'-5' RNA ligase